VASEDLASVHAFESTLVNVDLTNTPKKSNKLLYITLQLILKNNEAGTLQNQASSGRSGQCRSVYIYRRILWVENYVTKDAGDRIWKMVL
jgi:hypothetical protein